MLQNQENVKARVSTPKATETRNTAEITGIPTGFPWFPPTNLSNITRFHLKNNSTHSSKFEKNMVFIWRFPISHRGTLKIIHLIFGFFNIKPSSYWGTTTYGNPHMMKAKHVDKYHVIEKLYVFIMGKVRSKPFSLISF